MKGVVANYRKCQIATYLCKQNPKKKKIEKKFEKTQSATKDKYEGDETDSGQRWAGTIRNIPFHSWSHQTSPECLCSVQPVNRYSTWVSNWLCLFSSQEEADSWMRHHPCVFFHTSLSYIPSSSTWMLWDCTSL